MCLGVPAKIIEIKDPVLGVAIAETDGVRREVNLAMLLIKDKTPESLLECWVLLHVGFAMAVIDEQQALDTLNLLKAADNAL
ncbi:MAG: HypC/HybG/HupF family hydrogenase formation chaperone [Aestuariibacter sp.]